jgi:AcrR family transcriptional regulator
MEAFLAEHAFRLLTDTPDAPFNHEAVAQAAGISARTAYRYFPAQSDLVEAVWRHLRDTTGTVWPATFESILPNLRALFAQFERNSTVTRAMLAASPRANYSEHGSSEGRLAFRTALAERLDGMSVESGEQLVATCVAIYSAPFWQMLRDRGQLSASAAADAACTAMHAVIRAAPDGAARPPSATAET